MKNILIATIFSFICLYAIGAQALLITPSLCTDGTGPGCWYGDDPVNPKADDIEAIVGIGFDLVEVYKDNEGGVEEGPLQAYYNTEYLDSPDPSNADITYTGDSGDPSISCPECFLLVKDGNNDPRWYIFDLTSLAGLVDWNGTDTLELRDFWFPGGGSISHIALYSGANPIPEPTTMALLGAGLAGLIGLRGRRRNK